MLKQVLNDKDNVQETVVLNLFQDLKQVLEEMLNQVQHDRKSIQWRAVTLNSFQGLKQALQEISKQVRNDKNEQQTLNRTRQFYIVVSNNSCL